LASRGQAAGSSQDPHAGHGHDHQAGASAGPVRPGCGSRIWTDDQLDHFFGVAHAQGIQVHAHAIGDAAIDQGLDAYARLAAHASLEGRGWVAEPLPRLPVKDPSEEDGGLGNHAAHTMGRRSKAANLGRSAPQGSLNGPPADKPSLRHRFEHYEIVHDDQVSRTVELGIVSSSQPNFVGEWSAKGGMYHARLGDRYLLNNRFRTFLDTGIALAFGSDGMPFGPLVGLQSAIDHPDPAQRLTPAEAIWHYTTAAAWSLHWEDAVGSLAPGLKADLMVVDKKALDGRPTEWILKETISGGVSRGGNKQAIPAL
jgi:predicted amidohydrolase YtcJ